jgi:hypothetical protein
MPIGGPNPTPIDTHVSAILGQLGDRGDRGAVQLAFKH